MVQGLGMTHTRVFGLVIFLNNRREQLDQETYCLRGLLGNSYLREKSRKPAVFRGRADSYQVDHVLSKPNSNDKPVKNGIGERTGYTGLYVDNIR